MFVIVYYKNIENEFVIKRTLISVKALQIYNWLKSTAVTSFTQIYFNITKKKYIKQFKVSVQPFCCKALCLFAN